MRPKLRRHSEWLQEVWADAEFERKEKYQQSILFPIGALIFTICKIFLSVRAIPAPLSKAQVGIYNVTFEPKCRNNWHIHNAENGSGQILVA